MWLERRTCLSNRMWGHPHVIPSLIQSRFTSQLPFLCPYTSQHTDLVNNSLTTTANHSLSITRLHSQLRTKHSFHITVPRLHATCHAYRICRLANGRAGQTAEVSIKKVTLATGDHSTPTPGTRHIIKRNQPATSSSETSQQRHQERLSSCSSKN